MKIVPFDRTRPAPTVLEVSVFGPGYGECVLCHLGANEWMIVDSCMDFRRGVQPALEYLRLMGIRPETDVTLVVATHWHDDHVRGISEVVLACSSARFSCSLALRDSEFPEAVGRLSRPQDQLVSGLREMRRVFEILGLRSGFDPVRWAIADRPLFARPSSVEAPEARVTALSPSDAEFHDAMTRFGLLSGEVARGARASSRGPNHTAVVLIAELSADAVLLGADLEEHGAVDRGWSAILSSATRPRTMSSTYKVSHHGSENGDHPGIWTDMLDSPIAILTPFRRGSVRLPTSEMLERIAQRSAATFIAARPDGPTGARMPRRLESMARTSAVRVRELHGAIGHVRVRYVNGEPFVALRNPAARVA